MYNNVWKNFCSIKKECKIMFYLFIRILRFDLRLILGVKFFEFFWFTLVIILPFHFSFKCSITLNYHYYYYYYCYHGCYYYYGLEFKEKEVLPNTFMYSGFNFSLLLWILWHTELLTHAKIFKKLHLKFALDSPESSNKELMEKLCTCCINLRRQRFFCAKI